MSEEQRGKLVRRKSGPFANWLLTWTFNNKPYSEQNDVVARVLDDSLRNASEADLPVGQPVDVYFTKDNSRKLSRVWPVDAGLAERAAAAAIAERQRLEAEKAEKERQREAARQAAGEPFADAGVWKPAGRNQHFHNPYNFIPVPDGRAATDSGLGHGKPAGHHLYKSGLYSGRIAFELTTETPLIVADTARADVRENKHRIFDVLTDADGKTPILPITSFKGALRAAYEAVTLSRMAVFRAHDEKLARRMSAQQGLMQVPLRVKDDGMGFEVLLGSHDKPRLADNLPSPGVPGGLMYAAWLPRYVKGAGNPNGPAEAKNAVRCLRTNALPQHGDRVACALQRYEKLNPKTNQPIFSYWRVVKLVIGGSVDAIRFAPGRLDEFGSSHNHRPFDAGGGRGSYKFVTGHVVVTNQNIGGKHDERVFFTEHPHEVGCTHDEMRQWRGEWKTLIQSYLDANKRAMEMRLRNVPAAQRKAKLAAFLGNDINKYAYSRHLIEEGAGELKPGDLLFGRFEGGKLKALYPVMIARELGDFTPEDALARNHRPAENWHELSPADRVFGWVGQEGGDKGNRNMYRGQLRIASLDYAGHPGGEPIARFRGDGLPLAILSTPKPQQARFYLAADRAGTPPADGAAADQSFYKGEAGKKTLRGRKVYPHHRATTRIPGYWDGLKAIDKPGEPLAGPDKRTYYREYIRQAGAREVRDDQNRSIRGWITPQTTFRGEIDVINLSKAELGALLWLLDLSRQLADPMAHLRLGMGKPLGFGSVSVRLTGLDLQDGEARRADYASLFKAGEGGERLKAQGEASSDAAKPLVEAYRAALSALFAGKPFDEVSVIKAFRNAACGIDDLPVHYPRATPAPDGDGKNFEWFVANNKEDRNEPGPKYALPPLWSPAGLPLPDKTASSGSGGGRR